MTDDSIVFAGGSLAFDFVLTNLGNATDAFNLALNNTDFPAGTIFDFVAADGVTPIIGDSVTLGTDETLHVQLIATLPAATPATPAPAGFDAEITATSQADPAATGRTAVSFVGTVEVPSIDLVNTDGAGTLVSGVGNGNTDNAGAPLETVATNPGEQVTFNLQIGLEAGQPANSFELGAGPLPEGWVVAFFLPDGTPIQSTGALVPTDAAGAVIDYIAVVTIPEGAPPATEDILFTATSPSNGASDGVLNAVSVNEIINLSLAADTDVQAAPGGVSVIPHTVTNLGNSLVMAGDLELGLVDPFTDQGLTAALFYDGDDDGLLSASDPLISNLSDITGPDSVAGLSPNETARIFIRVQVPATSGLGLVETGDLAISGAITTEHGSGIDADTTDNSVFNSIAIVSGDVTIIKEQALDLTCDGTRDSVFTRGRQLADPGQCIVYRLEADNTGTSNASDVILRDVTPAFTTIETCGGSCAPSLVIDGTPGTVGVVPASDTSGVLATATPGSGFTLAPGSRAELTFTVQIDA